ncbi:serine--tRNA ligase, mitochondrial [Neodiprion lecontei]|uniref:serine--tRNA ligase n=1 Tax=Neodiprion lecontei TaxID=441921 RepID=A0A6J0C960_NEOLC|nr:serine--tRNA ligase, mitochondrial [Neodiprion lecontei]
MNFSRRLANLYKYRSLCTDAKTVTSAPKVNLELPQPEYDIEYLCDVGNRKYIAENIKQRKGIGDIDKVHQLLETSASRELLDIELGKIPNQTDPRVSDYGPEGRVLNTCGSMPTFNYQPKEFEDLAKNLKLIRTENLGQLSGSRSYMLLGDLAELEEALVYYTLRELVNRKFQVISVPDILPSQIIERCGMIVEGTRTQVYYLDSAHGHCQSLSGTAEMAIAGKLAGARLSLEHLPLKYAAVSRCYRAEASSIIAERGLYRVHQFTKVEMFVCCQPHQSAELLNELQSIEEELFSSLGIHFKVVDMPPHELGAPAYRKLDIEGWMPGRKLFGELSSCSNCTDYQSRRLGIKYETADHRLEHVHTLNGTACAIPRMLIALCETHQTEEGIIKIPEKLLPFMKGKTIIEQQPVAAMRFAKYKPKIH